MNKEDAKAVYDRLDACNTPISFQRGYLDSEQLNYSFLDSYALAEVNGQDIRNYTPTFLDGLPEARELFADYLGVMKDEVIIYADTARRVLHDLLLRAWVKGTPSLHRSYPPWMNFAMVNFPVGGRILCPVPGYDNHHLICEDIGLPMIPVPMLDNGPDMDVVEQHAKYSYVKGIICVPRYHNPTGVTYSSDVVRRLACMNAAPDFRIFWDCAYLECHYTRCPDYLLNIMDECRKVGNSDRPLLIFSTSKITHPSQSIAGVGGSLRNMAWVRELVRSVQTNPALVNQFQHVRFLKSVGGISKFMHDKHGLFLGDKMALVAQVLMAEMGLSGRDVVWSMPEGGYSFCIQLKKPCALRVVELAAAKGVLLHDPRGMYPYKNDPDNKFLRIMPSAVSEQCITAGMRVVSKSIQLALAECD